METVCIAIGSNVGDRFAHVRAAFDALAGLPRTRRLAESEIYETDPVGPKPQGLFLNAAASLATDLSPVELLAHMQAIEAHEGRTAPDQRSHWGPRTLDLDLVLYGSKVLDQPGLVVPHPMMCDRWFVLKPLADVAPDAIHPVRGQSVAALLAAVEREKPGDIGHLAENP